MILLDGRKNKGKRKGEENMTQTTAYQKPVTLKSILAFAAPTMAMSLFMSFYTMVDGLFVSNYIGSSALAAVNLTAPVIQLITAVSAMLAAGGSAVIMKKMGQQKETEARQDFTFLILANVAVGLLLCGAGYLLIDRLPALMNLSAQSAAYCAEYLSRYLLFTVPILLMNNFTLYLIASEKSALSLICSVCGGLLNILLDYIFIAKLGLGLGAAAVATGLGYSVTAVVGLAVFSRRSSLLHFVKPVFRLSTLVSSASNGCSEMATSLVSGVVTLLFNWTMLQYVGEDGVAAVTIIMYVLMFASSLYTGYSYGVAPMVSYYYGEQNREKLKKLVSLSLKTVGIVSLAVAALSFVAAGPLVSIFVRPDDPVYSLALRGDRLCSLALLFIGFNIFASGLFTALSNGVISAVLAFSRSFVFMSAAMLALPAMLGVDGVWLATPAAELAAFLLSALTLIKYRKRYHY